MTAGVAAEAGMEVVLGSGDSAGVAGEVAEADAGTGVEDATGTGEEAGGAPALTGCPAELPTGVCDNAVVVKKMSALRTRKSLFIRRVCVMEFTTASTLGPESGSVSFYRAGGLIGSWGR